MLKRATVKSEMNCPASWQRCFPLLHVKKDALSYRTNGQCKGKSETTSLHDKKHLEPFLEEIVEVEAAICTRDISNLDPSVFAYAKNTQK